MSDVARPCDVLCFRFKTPFDDAFRTPYLYGSRRVPYLMPEGCPLMQLFKVAKDGEAKRYKPFKKLPNRKLLWHGSRLSNFAGILSQGLRIAPPEAPVVSGQANIVCLPEVLDKPCALL